MGIKQSSHRLLGWKTEDDQETEIPYHPYSFLQGRQRYDHNYRNDDNNTSYTSFSERLRKIFSFHSLLYNALKGIVHKFSFSVLKPKKRAEPILPVVDPTPSIINDPLLEENLVNSSPHDFGSSAGSSPFAHYSYFCRDEEWPEQSFSKSINQVDDVTISIPNFTYSLSDTTSDEEVTDSTVTNKEIDPQNFVCLTVRTGGQSFWSEEDEEEIKNVFDVVNEAKWIKHYCNRHRILLVGEGDFSFSASLAVAFCVASNMIATSMDSIEFLKKNYKNAPANIENLRNRDCKVVHGIDATKIANNAALGLMTFDRIIFNFPFAGFSPNLSPKSQLRRHRRLVSLFLKNAKEMISEDGEIHITHKTNGWHGEWKLEAVASSHRLRLIEAADFNHLDYPGYNTKYGFGGDKNFYCNPSKTYSFGLKG